MYLNWFGQKLDYELTESICMVPQSLGKMFYAIGVSVCLSAYSCWGIPSRMVGPIWNYNYKIYKMAINLLQARNNSYKTATSKNLTFQNQLESACSWRILYTFLSLWITFRWCFLRFREFKMTIYTLLPILPHFTKLLYHQIQHAMWV